MAIPVIDSHVHLWTASHLNTLAWHSPSNSLGSQHSVKEYLDATSTSITTLEPASSSSPSNYRLKGFIYVETDRISSLSSEDWTHVLDEVSFLTRIVRGTPPDGEGHTSSDKQLCLAMIPWAPVPLGPTGLELYMSKVKERTGQDDEGASIWKKIKGVRYLIQDKRRGTMLEDSFIHGLKWLDQRGLAFDLGVDVRRGGIQQLEETVELTKILYKEGCQVKLILKFIEWKRHITSLSAYPNTYMKLSGLFSELPPLPRRVDDELDEAELVSSTVEAIQPWTDAIFTTFGTARVMFGSDWPICNIGGGDNETTWTRWMKIVEMLLERRGTGEDATMTSPEIPAQAKAMVYDKPGSVSTKLTMVDVPEPGTGQVLVNLTHSGVCHSDLSVMTSGWPGFIKPTQSGQVGGHEGVGKVVKFGPGAESSGLKIGDRVGIKWVSSACGNCAYCLEGTDGCCLNQKVSGYYTPGTFQQYVLGPAHYVTPIPDGLPSDEAAPMLCAGVTVYAALKRSRAEPGQWVVIPGAGGGLGHIATQLSSKGLGHRVIGIDHGSKEKIALDSGAEHFIDMTQYPPDEKGTQALVEKVNSLTGGLGAHVAIVCPGSNTAYTQSLQLLRTNGTLVCVGLPEHEVQPIASCTPSRMIKRSLTVVGSLVGNRKEAIEVLDFAARGLIKTHFRVEKMENLTNVFEEMNRGEIQGRVVLDLS
ncbi:alcohol dehydrogenase [Arthroderma uncinatum]|uniref:alcohol dehydrogenase n=1 Tax=Arthroderma uncinatum TaxID=74035 RepID=UPI00144AA01D|nr:alcohol dehydrogenase [Arthroderma uncinatum]KAF3481771.1 alcohol dehydrogenase [Arthroderma uncinatum]